MTRRVSAIKLPFHRRHLWDFWRPRSNPKLHEVHFLIEKLVLLKLWKDGLGPGQEVPLHIQTDADDAKDQIAKAAVENDVCFAREYFEAIKENRDLFDPGQNLRRKIILAYSQFYYENNPWPRPLVWVEATDRPRGISLAPHSGWRRAEPVEPTRDQLRDRLAAGGMKFTKRAYNAYLRELGLDDLKAAPVGRPRGKPKIGK
jgi:hypothetical protein